MHLGTNAGSAVHPDVNESRWRSVTRERESNASVVHHGRCLLARSSKERVPFATRPETITAAGHFDIANWLSRSRRWSELHHLKVLTPERTLALLRDDFEDIHRAAGPGGPTPLWIADALAAKGEAAEGTAAFLVLQAAKPWSRKTHKYFPEPARARAAELLRVGQWFKRLPNDFPIPFEVFEVFVMPHMVTRDYQPPATD